jgi:hypothetical protein
VYGPAGLDVKPRIGHVHVTVDEAPGHWVDSSGDVITQGLLPGPHRILVELANPMHQVIDSKVISVTVPERAKAF